MKELSNATKIYFKHRKRRPKTHQILFIKLECREHDEVGAFLRFPLTNNNLNQLWAED